MQNVQGRYTSKEEQEVIDISVKMWNAFVALGDHPNPDMVTDFRFHLHAMQSIIFTRAGIREQAKIHEYAHEAELQRVLDCRPEANGR